MERKNNHNYIDFKEVNRMIHIEEVAIFLGIQVKNHTSLCCFHKEKTPSLRFFENRYKCFGCGVSGDSIKLVSEMLGIKPLEAVKVLNDKFNLGLDFGKKMSYSSARQRKAKQGQKKGYAEWYSVALLMLSDYIRLAFEVENAETLSAELKAYGKAEVARVELMQDGMLELEPMAAYETLRNEVEKIGLRLSSGQQRIAKIISQY